MRCGKLQQGVCVVRVYTPMCGQSHEYWWRDLNSHPSDAPLCPFSAPLAYCFHPPLRTVYCPFPIGNPIPPSLEPNSLHFDNFCPRFSTPLPNSNFADWWVALNSGEKDTFPLLMPGFINITNFGEESQSPTRCPHRWKQCHDYLGKTPGSLPFPLSISLTPLTVLRAHSAWNTSSLCTLHS